MKWREMLNADCQIAARRGVGAAQGPELPRRGGGFDRDSMALVHPRLSRREGETAFVMNGSRARKFAGRDGSMASADSLPTGHRKR
jgi:hypothetical protein